MTSRKDIFAALFALVSNAASFKTTSRSVRHWSDVHAPDQPAVFQAEGKQLFETQTRSVPGKQTLHAELILYAHQENVDDGADVVELLNDLVDAIVAALAPLPGAEKQTLGGLVSDARIEGTIDTSEGRLGVQAVAVIPIVIIATH